MVAENTTGTRRTSPLKLALAAALTITFIVVVIVQLKSLSPQEGAAVDGSLPEAQAAPDSAPNLAQARGVGLPLRPVTPQGPWPEIGLAECIAWDPFRLPPAFLPPKPQAERQADDATVRQQVEEAQRQAARRQAIADLAKTGVGAVLAGPGRKTAIVGDQQLQIGQELHGYRVIAIEAGGVVLEEIRPTAAAAVP
ncbi:MAG: hypothetical protein ACYC6Y_18665 [Thermoguttaceae bacterium]